MVNMKSNPALSLKITNEIASAGRNGFQFDPSHEEHREYLFNLYGGETFVKEHFPLLYKELVGPLESDAVQAKALLSNAVQSITNIIDYLVYSNKTKKLTAHILSFFPTYMTGTGTVSVNVKRTGTPAFSKKITITNRKFLNETVVWDVSNIDAYKNETFVATFVLTPYSVASSSNTPGTVTFNYTIPVCELTDTIISKINVVDPICKNGTLNNVNVNTYKRSTNAYAYGASIDYNYTDVGMYTSLRNDWNNLFLEFSGSAEFNDTTMVFKGATVNDAWLSINNDAAFVNYDISRLAFVKDSFSASAKGFKWDLKKSATNRETVLQNVNWHSDLDSALFGSAGVDFYFHIHFTYGKSGDPSSNKEGCMILSSTLESDETYKKKMPKICFYRGCLAGDTEILMGDGSKKQITAVEIGEYVSDYDGEKVKVINKTKGIEDNPSYIIRVEGSNCYLKASRDHVIKTDRGLLPAYELRGNDKIETQNHQFAAIEELFLDEIKDVYNLELENSAGGDGSLMIANGLIVGDAAMQHNHVYEPDLPEIDQSILDELRKIEAYFNTGSESPNE